MSRSVTLRAVAATVVVAGLLVVVALTAGSFPGGDPGGTAGREWGIDRAELAAVMRQVLFVAYLAVLAHAFHLWLTQRLESKRSGLRRSSWAAAGSLAVLLLVVLGVFVFRLALGDKTDPSEESTTVTTVPVAGGGGIPLPEGTPQPTSPTPDWPVVAVGLGILALVAAVGAIRRLPSTSRAEMQAASPPGERRSAPSPEASSHSDPRERVFAAYRNVDRTAWLVGEQRNLGETVSSHLRRLADVGPVEVPDLVSVYNRARFSPHPVSSDDADRAEEAAVMICRRLR